EFKDSGLAGFLTQGNSLVDWRSSDLVRPLRTPGGAVQQDGVRPLSPRTRGLRVWGFEAFVVPSRGGPRVAPQPEAESFLAAPLRACSGVDGARPSTIVQGEGKPCAEGGSRELPGPPAGACSAAPEAPGLSCRRVLLAD